MKGDYIRLSQSDTHPVRIKVRFSPSKFELVLYGKDDYDQLRFFFCEALPESVSGYWESTSHKGDGREAALQYLDDCITPEEASRLFDEIAKALPKSAVKRGCHYRYKLVPGRKDWYVDGGEVNYKIVLLDKYKQERAKRPLQVDQGAAQQTVRKAARINEWHMQRQDPDEPLLGDLPTDVVVNHILPLTIRALVAREWLHPKTAAEVLIDRNVCKRIQRLASVCRAFRAQLLAWPSTRVVLGLSGKGIAQMWDETSMPGNFTCPVCRGAVSMAKNRSHASNDKIAHINRVGFFEGRLRPMHRICVQKGTALLDAGAYAYVTLRRYVLTCPRDMVANVRPFNNGELLCTGLRLGDIL